jgi:hypothetical protein
MSIITVCDRKIVNNHSLKNGYPQSETNCHHSRKPIFCDLIKKKTYNHSRNQCSPQSETGNSLSNTEQEPLNRTKKAVLLFIIGSMMKVTDCDYPPKNSAAQTVIMPTLNRPTSCPFVPLRAFAEFFSRPNSLRITLWQTTVCQQSQTNKPQSQCLQVRERRAPMIVLN